MKAFRKILMITFSILILTVVLIFGALFWALKNPESAWRIAEKYVLPNDLKVTWSEMSFRGDRLEGLDFYFDWKITGLKILKGEPRVDMSFDTVHLDATVYPLNSERKILVHQFQLQSSQTMSIQLLPSEPVAEQNPYQTLRNILNKTIKYVSLIEIEALEAAIKRFEILQTNETTIISAEVIQSQKIDQGDLHYKTQVQLPHEMILRSEGTHSASQKTLEGQIDFQGAGLSIDQKFIFKVTGETIDGMLQGPIAFAKNKFRVTGIPNINLKMNPTGLEFKIKSTLKGIPEKYVGIHSVTANGNIPFEPDKTWSERPATFEIFSPIKVFIVDDKMKRSLRKACDCELPNTIQFQSKGKVWLAHFFSKSSNKEQIADLSVRLDDVTNKIFSLKTAATMQMFKTTNDFTFAPSIDLDAKVLSFKILAKILDIWKILVPSPFDVLDGTVSLKMNGPVNFNPQGYQFPCESKIALSSSQQIVDIDTKSSIFLDSKFKSAQVDVHTIINQLQLELPPLKPTSGIPRIVPDKRIITLPPQKKLDGFKLAVNFDVSTKQPRSIRLLSEYFKPNLPMTIDLKHIVEKENTGAIQFQSFDIVYLRRTLHIEKLSVDLSQKVEKSPIIDGHFSVQQSEYKILIDVNGPANRPNIVLTSEPYLPRSEIINVLLYDRTSDQLISADVQTAGQVEAAVADRAIGLFGIWAFASTPIKGFTYNPSTKVYTALVELSDDVSASIGTNWEAATQVELRKRLSGRWMLTAAWSPAEQGEPESTKIVLQWERRY